MNPSPAMLWRLDSALVRAREGALEIARHLQQEALSAATGEAQVYQTLHLGYEHLDFFQAHFPQTLALLPSGFRALEVGAGMGWHAALVASRGAELVLATEVLWGEQRPTDLPNVFALHRLSQRDEALAASLRFDFDEAKELRGVQLPPALRFLRADAGLLPVRSGALDFHYSYNCLEHVPNPSAYFQEAARVLRPGGVLFASTQPLYFSPFGHHLQDVFPLPWGHLLWEPKQFLDIVMENAASGREWAPGVPLRREHLEGVFATLNWQRPEAFRAALRQGPWKVLGWVDRIDPEHERWASWLNLGKALRASTEALLQTGLTLRLERLHGFRGAAPAAPLFLPSTVRRRVRRFKRQG